MESEQASNGGGGWREEGRERKRNHHKGTGIWAPVVATKVGTGEHELEWRDAFMSEQSFQAYGSGPGCRDLRY